MRQVGRLNHKPGADVKLYIAVPMRKAYREATHLLYATL